MANPFKSHPRVKNTDGRVPTTTLSGPKADEGNTSVGVSKKGTLGPNPDEGAIERTINRGAAGFRNDIVKRSQKVRGKRGRRPPND